MCLVFRPARMPLRSFAFSSFRSSSSVFNLFLLFSYCWAFRSTSVLRDNTCSCRLVLNSDIFAFSSNSYFLVRSSSIYRWESFYFIEVFSCCRVDSVLYKSLTLSCNSSLRLCSSNYFCFICERCWARLTFSEEFASRWRCFSSSDSWSCIFRTSIYCLSC